MLYEILGNIDCVYYVKSLEQKTEKQLNFLGIIDYLLCEIPGNKDQTRQNLPRRINKDLFYKPEKNFVHFKKETA